MFLFKKYLVNTLMAFGVVLWVGALSPEIFIRTGLGCVLDENGEELTADGAEEFMESYFYGDTDADAPVEIQYKFALSELFR
ncbi:MAG: hypothetical protein HFH75_05825 [Lachnospiraceae bacterium]|jgi:hypothetical protein|nr:hypothetical protein [Lachnospiraceae bacterium]MDE6921614.1 hypothetical protein [Lachnospiraceae bacterium]MDE6941173.1 hypothetical protein [Lachnospiraceae bacterium]MDE6989138.1 hypothetical protein [Lachnospiraceae bacterium]